MTLRELNLQLDEERQALRLYQNKLRKAQIETDIYTYIKHIKNHRKNITVIQSQINSRKKLDHMTNGY